MKIDGTPSVRAMSVVGLGKLGSPLAACVASKGYHVIGVDIDPHKIQSIDKGSAPVYEPGLQALIQRCEGRLTATDDYERAIRESQLTFIAVATPADEKGGFSTRYVLQACEQIGKVLRNKEAYHLVVLTSTVLPGATENEIKPFLESQSGRRCGADFGLCYSPEFIALGTVIRDFLNPDFLLIGESDSKAGELLGSVYQTVCENNPPVARMNFVNAELTKLSVNTFVTTKITFANMVAQMCERLPGADVDVVTRALGLDSRIGLKYLKGALGYGGPCFPRDNVALSYLARTLGMRASLAEATDALNRQQVLRLAEIVKARVPRGSSVCILGLSYKPDTEVVEESQGLDLAKLLSKEGFSVMAYDPAAVPQARKMLDSKVQYGPSAEACVSQADLVVIATPWREFKNLCLDDPVSKNRPIVIDCWRILDEKQRLHFRECISIGVGVESEKTAADCKL